MEEADALLSELKQSAVLFIKEQLQQTYEEEYEDMKESAEDVEYDKHKGEEAEIDLFFEKIENTE